LINRCIGKPQRRHFGLQCALGHSYRCVDVSGFRIQCDDVTHQRDASLADDKPILPLQVIMGHRVPGKDVLIDKNLIVNGNLRAYALPPHAIKFRLPPVYQEDGFLIAGRSERFTPTEYARIISGQRPQDVSDRRLSPTVLAEYERDFGEPKAVCHT
jgi:hypothetical protein